MAAASHPPSTPACPAAVRNMASSPRIGVEGLHRRLAPTPDGHQGEVGAHESNQHDEDYMVLLSDLRRGCRDEAGVETKVAGAPYE